MTALIAAAAGEHAARAPRPRDSRAVLCLGPAPQRAGGTRSRGRQPRREDGAGARQGRQAAARPLQHEHGEGDSRVSQGPRAAGGQGKGRRQERRDSRTAGRRQSRTRTTAGPVVRELPRRPADRAEHRSTGAALRRGVERAPASVRTRSGIPSPRTCCSAARTCARFRSCSATRAQHDAAVHPRQRGAAPGRVPEITSSRHVQRGQLGRRNTLNAASAGASGAARRPRGNSMPSVLIL